MDKYKEALKKVYEIISDLDFSSQKECAIQLKILQELVDKETPKKPIVINNENTCPNCSEQTLRFFRKCCWCGQRIDWGDE